MALADYRNSAQIRHKARRQPRILVIDSGLGGLTVHRAILRKLLNADIIYVADNAGFPYGDRQPEDLTERVGSLISKYAGFEPDVVVIACNTASTAVLSTLRKRFTTPFVGTVPAVKVAAARSRSRMFTVLATPGTIDRDYTNDLIAVFRGDCEVTLVGPKGLAQMAEDKMKGRRVDRGKLAGLVAPAFVKNGTAQTDIVVLACTHFPLLLEELREIAPWKVQFIDPAPAIADQTVNVLSERFDCSGATRQKSGSRYAVFTAPLAEPARLRDALFSFGIDEMHVEKL